jgi:SAM-dependent methyltransferase
MGVGHIVKAIEHDVTAESLISVLSGKGTVDVVTMSYSFSMIPDRNATIKNINQLLKPNGHVLITDFFVYGNYDEYLSPLFANLRSMERWFHRTWWSFDHVFLLEDDDINFNEDAWEVVWDKRERGAVPFLPFLKPYHGVFIMRKKAT